MFNKISAKGKIQENKHILPTEEYFVFCVGLRAKVAEHRFKKGTKTGFHIS